VIIDLLAGLEHAPPAETLAVVNRILQYDPHDFATLLVKAEVQARSGDRKGSKVTLDAAERASGDGAPKVDQVAALRALVTVQDPDSKPGDLDLAKRALVRLLHTDAPPRPADLCQALLGLAEKKPAYREDVLNVLDAFFPKLPSGGSKDRLVTRADTLRQSAASRLVRQLESRLRTAKETDWVHLLADCEKARFTGLGLAGLAESILEQRRRAPPLQIELQQARAAAFDAKAEREAGAYAHYVRARVEQASGKPTLAAQELMQAIGADASWIQGFRRDRAVSILEKAADGLRRADRPTNPFATPEKADLAYTWLKTGSELLTEAQERVPVSLQINLALAAGHKTQPDRERARLLTDQLVKAPDRAIIGEAAKLLGEAAYPLWLVHARAQEDTPQGRKTAFDSYDEAIRLGQKDLDTDRAADFDQSVLGPAIQLGEKILQDGPNPEIQKRLARLRALRDQLPRRAP
jgi:hypothetical protein